jgi:hypothetical protein
MTAICRPQGTVMQEQNDSPFRAAAVWIGVFPASWDRTLMATEARVLFVMTVQRCCQHKRDTARLYRALAAHASNTARRALLLALAANREHRARRYIACLAQRGVPMSADRDTRGARMWRWVLVRCGVTCAMAWTEWVEANDRRLLVTLARALRTTRSSLRAEVRLLKERRG